MPPHHVYVHVPFCARRCSYCDFAIAVRSRVPVDEYLAALAAELTTRRVRETATDPVQTLYFGGGTPSRLGADGVARAIALLREHVALAADAEVTLEANPDDVDDGAIAAWRDAGVNRLSLGGQSFDPGVLAWMHRTHDVAQIGRAMSAARRGGIENVSLDLIFAVPDRLDRSWTADLRHALDLGPTHVSLYGLTVEAGTPLGRWRERGEVSEAGEDRYADEFIEAHETMTAAGFEHYEVSNFGLPRRHSRHNRSYWRGVSYLGLGPSAHGFDGVTRRWNVASYADWQRRSCAGDDPLAGSEVLTDENRMAEGVYLGLRTSDGLELRADERPRVARWIDAGWATLDGSRLRLTAAGWLRLDSLAADLTVTRSR